MIIRMVIHLGLLAKRKAKKFLDEAIQKHQMGNLREAEHLYVESLSYDPNSEAAHLNYGDLLRQTNRPKAAMVEYNKAMVMNPEIPDPYEAIGRLQHSLNNYQEAEKFYKKALEFNPGNVNTQMNLAQLYMDTARYSDMRDIYTNIINKVKDPRLRSKIEERLK